MNLIGSAPDWLLAILCVLIVAAGIQDLLQLRIPNAFPAAVLVAAAIAIILRGWSVELWENLAVFATLLALGTLLFSRGYMGGGDVKLFAAVGLWTDFEQALVLIPAILLSGGVLAVLLLSRRLIPRPAGAGRRARTNRKVPYGLAIATGTLILVGGQAQSRLQSHEQVEKLWALTSNRAR